jgi:hypothetical protein
MSDGLFHVVDDAQIVLRSKGVFKQVKIFHRDGKLYAGWGSGFVRLLASGGTSKPDVSWEALPDMPEIARTSLEIQYLPPEQVKTMLEHKS